MTTNIGSTTTYFVGAHYEVVETNTGTQVNKYYGVYPASGGAGTQRIAMRKNGELFYLLSDHLGSTSIVTDASGIVVSQTKYKAWGEVRYSSGASPTQYTYTGQYSHTADFGLMFYNARWYDPGINQFTSPDTLIPNPYNTLDWNRYAYARYNPLRYTDPTGHCVDACVIEAFAVLTVFAFITTYVYTTPEMQDLGKQFAENFSANLEDAVESVTSVFAEESLPLDEGDNANESPIVDPSDILMPDSKPIGKPGERGEHIREVNEGEISEIWEDLSESGTEIVYPGYDKGEVLELLNFD
ncbi:RHS repeat-associated core domain-containing protein [Chloroflexi bacterium CFX2]|nr:RHS repeat-associated core domain-containing protein [Chloroflexi bacterium CFX2]